MHAKLIKGAPFFNAQLSFHLLLFHLKRSPKKSLVSSFGTANGMKKKENHHHWPCKVSRKSFAKERKETFFLSLLFTILWDGRKSSTRKKEIYKYLIAGKKSRPKLRNNKGKKKKEPRREKKNVMEQRIGIGGSLRNDYFDFFLISYA